MFKNIKHWYYTRVKGYLCWNDMSEKEKSHFLCFLTHLNEIK